MLMMITHVLMQGGSQNKILTINLLGFSFLSGELQLSYATTLGSHGMELIALTVVLYHI